MPRCVSQYHSLPFRPQSIFKASASLVILVSTCPIRAHPSSEHLCAILVTAENIGTSQGAGWVYPPIAKNPRGENFSCDGGHAVSRGRVKTFLTPGEGARIPARRATHRTPAPKAGAVLCLSVVSFPCGFATIPAPFYGCGSCGKGSPGWTDHRTHPSHPCGPRCGPRRWPWFGCLAWNTPGRRAPAGAVPAGVHAATCLSGTSSARTWPPRCGRWCASDGVHRSSRPAPRRCIQDVGKAGEASWPWAITSTPKRKKLRNQHPPVLGLVTGSGVQLSGLDRYPG